MPFPLIPAAPVIVGVGGSLLLVWGTALVQLLNGDIDAVLDMLGDNPDAEIVSSPSDRIMVEYPFEGEQYEEMISFRSFADFLKDYAEHHNGHIDIDDAITTFTDANLTNIEGVPNFNSIYDQVIDTLFEHIENNNLVEEYENLYHEFD